MKRLMVMAAAGLLAIGLAGCGSKGHKGSGFMGAHGSGLGSGEDPWGRSQEELLSVKTYYFDFDKFTVSDKDVPAVKAQARYLADHPKSHIRIEGHTDMRGSREYNVALGERRAHAVKALLSGDGVPESQMAVVSYGAEKPAAMGTDEEAYRLNRRAIIVFEDEQ